MFAKRKIIFVPLVCLIFGAVIEESGQLIPQEADCLRACRLAREGGSKTGIQILSIILSCHECLHRSKDHALNQQGIKQRKRKSLHTQPSDCPLSSPDQFEEWTPSEVEVIFGQYINTNHWYLNCSWTSMNDPKGQWNGILVRLVVGDLDNFVTPVNCYVLPKNQTFFSVNISSYHYHYNDAIYLKVIGLPFVNDASNISEYRPNTTPSSPITTRFRTRHQSTDRTAHIMTGPNTTPSSPITNLLSIRDQSTDGTAYITTGPNTITSSPIITHSSTGDQSTDGTAYITTESNSIVTYAVSISTGTLVGLLLVVGLLVYLWKRRKMTMIPLPSDFQYHAFIIYNNEDRLWMKRRLLPFLEDKNHLTCCIHYRDFVAGKPFRDCMAESVYKSHKVIALFSTNFVKSNYCKYELDIAIGRLVAHRDRSLVIIRIDEVDFKLLPPELRGHSVIDYNDHLEKYFWKQKLLSFLGLPEDSETHSTNWEGNCDNNNTITYHVNMNGNRTRTGFSRLNSTTSNDSEISYV